MRTALRARDVDRDCEDKMGRSIRAEGNYSYARTVLRADETETYRQRGTTHAIEYMVRDMPLRGAASGCEWCYRGRRGHAFGRAGREAGTRQAVAETMSDVGGFTDPKS